MDENDVLKFKENLLNAMIEMEITQSELAASIGTTQQTVSRWIHGINQPDLLTLMRICYYLNYTPDEILGYDNILMSAYEDEIKFDVMAENEEIEKIPDDIYELDYLKDLRNSKK